MKIELLYFDGCPSWEKALKNLKTALQVERINAEIELNCVKDNDHAAQLKFLGSFSFRGNIIDWWSEERNRYHLSCRFYATPEGMHGAPTVEMFRQQLRQMGKDK